jgi:DNA-binding MarR family transcriptional regulator
MTLGSGHSGDSGDPGQAAQRMRAPRQLDELLNYRLMRLFAVSSAPVIRLCEGGYGIARREWRILALLAAHGELSPSALAERGDLDRARTSRAVGSLVKKQLVRRLALQGDRRRARVTLTATGHRLYDELFPQVAEINRRLVAVLDDTVVAALDEALMRLTANAALLNQELSADVQADRRHGGSRRRWPLLADGGIDVAGCGGRIGRDASNGPDGLDDRDGPDDHDHPQHPDHPDHRGDPD